MVLKIHFPFSPNNHGGCKRLHSSASWKNTEIYLAATSVRKIMQYIVVSVCVCVAVVDCQLCVQRCTCMRMCFTKIWCQNWEACTCCLWTTASCISKSTHCRCFPTRQEWRRAKWWMCVNVWLVPLWRGLALCVCETYKREAFTE